MIYLTGDTHGVNGVIERLKIARKKIKGESILIVLGDFGLLWKKDSGKQIKYVQKYIDKNMPDLTLTFLAGNHENYDLIDNLPIEQKWGDEVGKVSKSIYHLKTGNIYTINNKTYAIYGGGLSIDKHYRKEGISWWAREIPSKEEIDKMVDNFTKYNWKVDYFLTHVAPASEITSVDSDLSELKIQDYVAVDVMNFKKMLTINDFHAFGHLHVDKDLREKLNSYCLYYAIIEAN